MKTTRPLIPSIALLFTALCLTACEQPTHSHAPLPGAEPLATSNAPLLLKTYTLKAGDPDRVRNVLQQVLQQHGNVETLPGNALLVSAPEHLHEGVAELISSAAAFEETPRQVIALDYWLVFGSVEPELDAKDRSAPRQLATLSKALDLVKQTDGYEHFALLDHIRLTTLDGEEGLAQSVALSEVQQLVSAQRDLYEARLKLKTSFDEEHKPRQLEITVRVKEGESMILGQAGYTYQGISGSLFYIVRATTVPQ